MIQVDYIYQGNALEVLRGFPDESIDCCVTSPPYWGLRYYPGAECVWGGEEGCEHSWIEFKVKHDNLRFRKGVSTTVGNNLNPAIYTDYWQLWKVCERCGALYGQLGLEPTLELYLEHLFEIIKEIKRVLKKEGTFFLNIGDTYWGGQKGGNIYSNLPLCVCNKGNIEDFIPQLNMGRPQGIKQKGYREKSLTGIPWRLALMMIDDGWILRNVIVWYKPNAIPQSVKDRFSTKWEPLFFFVKSKRYYFDLDAVREPYKPATLIRARNIIMEGEIEKGRKQEQMIYAGFNFIKAKRAHIKIFLEGKGANPGDVWEIATKAFHDAHFAVFPPDLVERCILAGCPEGGVVLDPFAGSGTTLMVAKKLGRRFIGIEVVKEYIEMCWERIKAVLPALFNGDEG